jgi:hypothetical protein
MIGKCSYCLRICNDTILVRLRSSFKEKWQEVRTLCGGCRKHLRGLWRRA